MKMLFLTPGSKVLLLFKTFTEKSLCSTDFVENAGFLETLVSIRKAVKATIFEPLSRRNKIFVADRIPIKSSPVRDDMFIRRYPSITTRRLKLQL